ncbi:MAG: glycerol-3-phosphate 1-O-acyltransferase PlsY [Gemmataceae bacterium]|nr:glycerol-3-phosphate 1-O-acyltransferase PlsY [Gemmataceae bacterium]
MDSVVVPVLWFVSYLVGALPFGYLVGRWKGVDLFAAGSGNIGATNVGRVLGRKYGIIVFSLDFLKGALPVAAIVPVTTALAEQPGFPRDWSMVGAAAGAFLGHLFPIYLRFRGGKGVATGAGTVAVLAPIPFAAALGVWLLALLVSRMVSLASILAVMALVAVQLSLAPINAVAGYCFVGSLFVVVKHRSNVGRLIAGTENQIGDGPMRQTILRVVHVVAVGVWVGAAGFFNFVVAPSLVATYPNVVKTAPSDRTAFVPIVPPGATEADRDNLGLALFGAGVGPIFPKLFALQLVCGVLAFATAWTWRKESPGRHRLRVQLAFAALASVGAGWWISDVVSRLRLARFDPDLAAIAKEQFATWHFVSLGLSFVTITLALALLVLAARLPAEPKPG